MKKMNRKVLLWVIIFLTILIIFLITIVFMAKKNMAEKDFSLDNNSSLENIDDSSLYYNLIDVNDINENNLNYLDNG